MQNDIPTRVAKGVALLDENKPGWVGRISLADLNIGDVQCCVLGQVYGDFHEGIHTLELCGGDEGCQEGEYGFDSLGNNMAEQMQDFKELQKEWVRVIALLRQKQQAEQKEMVTSGTS